MEKEYVTKKDEYEYGLTKIYKNLDELLSDKYYKPIVKYFTYPLAVMNNEVEEREKQGTADEEFYTIKCQELMDLYKRLVVTMIATWQEMPLREKIRRRLKK